MAKSDYINNGGRGDFTPLSELFTAIDYLDRVIPLGRANFPRLDSLRVGMAALVDDEFMQITAIVPGGVEVKRGCADTVPARHAALTLIWFVDTGVLGTDRIEYSAGDTTAVKYSPYTIGGGSMNVDESGQIDSVTYNWRMYRPYPPGQLRANGRRWWLPFELTADEPVMNLTWVHRDRNVQADKLLDHDDAGVGPEDGTTYTVRIYTEAGLLRRTEVGIMAEPKDAYGRVLPAQWNYHWQQAMSDLDAEAGLETGRIVPGKMTMFATRDGFDSWQGYEIPFTVDTQGYFLKVAQAAQIAAQGDDIEGGAYPPVDALAVGQAAQIAAQGAKREDYDDVVAAEAMFVAAMHEGAGQATSFYTGLNRNLFEAPYAHLRRVGMPIEGAHLVTVSARPGDRLTDSHRLWSRYDYPAGLGDTFEYGERARPDFTPWLTLAAPIDYLDTTVTIATSSFYDGVALDRVSPGQVAMLGAEVVMVVSRSATTFTIARGVYDTVPAKHAVNARMWFFQAAAGNDPTVYPITVAAGVAGAAAQVKLVPDVYGPPLSLDQVPTDRLDMAFRVERPYAPGEVLVNGRPWFNGAQIANESDTLITWRHRNRDTQGGQAIDHHAPSRAPEPGQRYRLHITITIYPPGPNARPYPVVVRSEIIDGESFNYSYAMAQTDGYRAGTLLKACGRVTVGMVLESVRDDFASWQNYVIPLLLPSYACPPGVPPGGGQLPPTTGGGNGNTGPDPTNPTQPPGDNEGDDGDPGDNGGGDNGNGPPSPPTVPPDWPDPIEPPAPDPEEPNPALAAHWDLNWDRHWDAYTKDNEGT